MGLGGSSSKYGGNRGGGSGGGRLPYGIMLLLAFGAAVFGVMVLHKFRERRIFNVLIKDKDTHIITLQLVLQKEKDYNKEMKKKIEEMKGKAFSLRTQKVELNNKIMDMQSLIGSFKEEGKALESELEEKRNEIKMLREKEIDSGNESSQVAALTELLKQKEAEVEDMKHRLENPVHVEIDSGNESSQVAALTELLKQKEAEVEDMKHRLENPVHVWSVSTDDPSKPVDNLSAKATNVAEMSIEEAEKTVNAKDGEVSAANSEGGIGNATEGAAKTTEVQEEKLQNIENRKDGEGVRNAEEIQERREVREDTKEKSDDSHNEEDFRMSGEKGNKNETEVVVESSREDEVLKTKVEDADKKPLENSQNGDGGQLLGMISGGDEIKMEVADGSQNVARTGASDGGNELRSKRWRKNYRNREWEKNESSIKGGGGLENNGSDQELKTGLGREEEGRERGVFAGKKLGEVFRNRKLELPENSSKYGEGLRTGTSNDDHQVGLEANEDTRMVSSSDGKLEQNHQTEAGEGFVKLRSENGDDNSGIEKTNGDSSQAMVSLDEHDDSGTKEETNATDSNQQLKKPTEPEDQQYELLPETHSTATTTVLKRQRLPKGTKGRKIRKLPMLAN